ncbi:hypothetical protein Avbf_18326, partial [Armadillidium vulgare]
PSSRNKNKGNVKAFKDRLKKQQYHDATIALELKLVNRYIAEKINDVRKCTSRRNLNMTYDIQGFFSEYEHFQERKKRIYLKMNLFHMI